MANETRPSVDRLFLVRWCIFLGIVAVLIGGLLPLFVDSPPYPQPLGARSQPRGN